LPIKKRNLASKSFYTKLENCRRSRRGITIKAQAYQACAALGKEEPFQATIHLGPSIAEDVCRVLSEGEEV
jgi:hypothetical protein